MSYEVEKLKFGREHINIVEIDLDYCSLSFGTAPCTASGPPGTECHNTFKTCQDLPNFTKTEKTYRFCEQRSPHPFGLDAIPSIQRVSTAPSEIDVGGGLGIRASVSVSLTDHPSDDNGIDPYADTRSLNLDQGEPGNPLERGTYWTKLRARNPNYQNRPMRVISGYLVDGTYVAENFKTRHYVIEKLDVTGGSVSIVGKDPLKLTNSKKSQVPAPSNGRLLANITNVATTATLTPTGIGNAEYPASGYVSIKKEIMSFTRAGDVLTLTRAQFNTVATAHNANDTVQLCYYKNDQVNEIVYDLLVNYANISSTYIYTTAWQGEVDTWLTGLLEGIIPTPTDVNKVLIELAEAMPHYLWWDEYQQLIQLTALKPPPEGADVLDMDENLVADSVRVADEKDKRISTVFVRFGIVNPMEKLDEPGNYAQTYARVDTDSISLYGSNEIKTINSRWISATNKAAALQLAAKIGRRFADIPRTIDFSLDPKDSDVWIGQSRAINHRDIVDFTGKPVDTVFQIISASEGELFKYRAIEYVYGAELPEDEGGGDPTVDLVIFGSSLRNINLRTVYDSLFPAPSGTTKAKFIIEPGVIIGSSSTTTDSMDTGSWPVGATVTIVNKGYIVGAGGNAGDVSVAGGNGVAGGDALNLNHNIILDNQGIIGGGGGGGGSSIDANAPSTAIAGGGGGAGDISGLKGFTGGDMLIDPIYIEATNGTITDGGDRGSSADPRYSGVLAYGGYGGDLGQAGTNATGGTVAGTGGAAGKAINLNGKTITYTMAGDIRGAVS